MADDNQLQISFTGKVDSSVTSSTKETKAAVDSVTKSVDALNTETSNVSGAKALTNDLGSVGVSAVSNSAKINQVTQAVRNVTPAAIEGSRGLAQVAKGAEAAEHGTAGFYREVVVLGHEMISGNFSRIPGSMMVMAERSGKLVTIFEALGAIASNPLSLGLVAVGAALAIVTVHANESAAELAKVQVQMQAVGNGASFNSALTSEYIDSLSKLAGISRKDATEAQAILGSSIHATADEIKRATEILPNLAAVLGDTASAAKFLKEAIDDPAKAAKALEERFGTLTAAEYMTIERMTELGDKAGATRVVLESLARTTKELHEEGLSPMGKVLEYVKENWVQLLGKVSGAAGIFIEVTAAIKDNVSALTEYFGLMSKAAYGPSTADFQKNQNLAVIDGLELAKQSGAEAFKRQEIEGKILQLQKDQAVALSQGNKEAVQQIQLGIDKYNKDLADLSKKDSKGAASTDHSEIEEFQAQLTDKLARQKVYGAQAKAEELKFWQEKLTTAKQGSTEYNEINDKIYALQSSAYDKDLQKFTENERKKVEAAKQSRDQNIQAYLKDENDLQKLDEKDFDKVKQIENQKLAFLKQIYGKDSAQYKEELAKKGAMDVQHVQQTEQRYRGMFQSMFSSFNSAAQGIISGTETMGQAIGSVFTSLLTSVVGIFEEMAEKWLVSQIVDQTASSTLARTQIGADAAVAAAAAFASTAAIPIVGPGLAPAAASAAYASTMAFQAAVPGFATGVWDLPNDMTANIHEGEMILPKPFADSVRENGGFGAGGGGDTHFHINAIDARGAAKWFQNNGPSIAKSIRGQVRGNNPNLGGMG